MSFFKKKEPPIIPYDPAAQEPAVRSSICTGEMVAGFIDRKTGKFREYELVRSRSDLDAFCARAGIKAADIKRIY